MQEDMIGNFVENVNRKLIKRNVRLTYALFNIVIVYILVCALEWYLILRDADFSQLNPTLIYYFFIDPFIVFALITITIICFSFLKKANKLIDMAFDQEDADHFNAAYSLFTKTSLLTIISYCIAITNILTRLILNL